MNSKLLSISLILICCYSCDYFNKEKPAPIPVSDSIQLDASFTRLESPLTAYVTTDSLEIYKLTFCTNEYKIGTVKFLDSVKIIAQLYNSEVDNQWSLIEYTEGAIKKQGFVKSFYLTNSILNSKSNPSFSYFIRKVDLKDTINYLITAYLIELENGKQKSSHFLDTFSSNEYFELSSKKIKLFNLKEYEVIFANNYVEECGKVYTEKIFLRTVDKLAPLFTNTSMGDADIFSTSDMLYYSDGKNFYPITKYEENEPLDSIPLVIKPYIDSPQYLISYISEYEGIYDEKTEDYKRDSLDETILNVNKELYSIYSWKKNKLVKQKEYDLKKY
jgi:hypothetical protein